MLDKNFAQLVEELYEKGIDAAVTKPIHMSLDPGGYTNQTEEIDEATRRTMVLDENRRLMELADNPDHLL